MPTKQIRSTLPLLVVLLAAACARGAAASPDVVIADSAGVKIITSGPRDTALAWTFEEIDVLRDSVGEPYLFNNVFRFQVLVDRAGRTYVLTRDPSIVRFDREGKQDLTLGRKGGGPGEFQLPMAIGSKSDTIWVHDAMKDGFVRFLPDLTPAPDQRLEGKLASANFFYFRTGGLWFRQSEYGDTILSQAVYADTLGGEPLARAATRQGGAVDFGCVKINAAPPIFAPQINMHASVARLLINTQPAYDLRLYEGSRLVGSVRRPLTLRAPTVEDVRLQYPNGMTISFGGGLPPCVAPLEKVMEQQGMAEFMPFVFDVVLLSDGSMWALRTPMPAPPVVDVFGPDGVYAGTMRGRGLPLAMLPNGQMLFAKDDEESGGKVVTRVKVTR